MTQKRCGIEGCERSARSRGWCNAHYGKWRRYGDPEAGRFRAELAMLQEPRFPVERAGDCLIWRGSLNRYGYGIATIQGRYVQAHRLAWERSNGPIPDGMVIDHAIHCDRACVNVEHLRLATYAENAWNLSGPHSDRKYDLPRGVAPAGGGGFRGYVMRHGVMHAKNFATAAEADKWATAKREELFGAFAGNG